tara:strand:- start:58 stop:294 length:237 start_codon:yes stop_codon:yes gene_type:complete
MASEYREKLMKKYKKLGVKFDKETGLPLGMTQIYKEDSELFMDLQNDYFTSAGTMDEGKPDLKKLMKKIKQMIKGDKK